MTLTLSQRRDVFDRVLECIERKCVWTAAAPERVGQLRERYEQPLLDSASPEQFERLMTEMLRELGSHAGIIHRTAHRRPARQSIAAVLAPGQTERGPRWVFRDVWSDGPAARSGIREGDVLAAVNGELLIPPDTSPLLPGHSYVLTLERADGTEVSLRLGIPVDTRDQSPVSTRRLPSGVGVIRIVAFPGVVGIDVARDISQAIADLGTSQLIVDLRANSGGGMGSLRVMSLMCADRRGVGYSAGRELFTKRGRFDKTRLPQFDHIPASRWGLVPLAVRFGFASRSVAVLTEALGPQRHHGRVVLLIDHQSASAAEMVAAFAQEWELAVTVGTKTPGRLAAMRLFNVGHGYRIGLPVAAYYTWRDASIEGLGVTPDVDQPLSVDALREGLDTQLARGEAILTDRSDMRAL
jgi:carboxyl-terminal processing protease